MEKPREQLIRQRASVLGTRVDVLTWDIAISRILLWADSHESRYVCICNVHSIVWALRDKNLRLSLENADIVTPDGMPVAWSLRSFGYSYQQRISGPDLMWKYCEIASLCGHKIFLYGSTYQTLNLLVKNLRKNFPDLQISGFYSPPFGSMSVEEDNRIEKIINASGANVILVGLGCPKQEKWMASKIKRIHGVMIGVGAAFDFHAGTIRRAPCWMQKLGLEWLFRLFIEPDRLWRRYFVSNSTFLIGILFQKIGLGNWFFKCHTRFITTISNENLV